MKSIIIRLSITLMLFASCCNSETPRQTLPPHGKLTVMTDDSLQQTGFFTPGPDEGRAPLIVMLPMLGNTHTSFDPMITEIKNFIRTDTSGRAPAIPNFLAVDLRGHGESTTRGDQEILYSAMDTTEFKKIPGDVAILLDTVLARFADRIDTNRVFVVGASIGANTAMLLTESISAIDKVVLLSPGSDYRGLRPAEAFKAFNGQTMIVTGREDAYSAKSAQALAGLKMENWIMKIYSHSEHGTDITNKDARAMQTVINWLFEESQEEQ